MEEVEQQARPARVARAINGRKPVAFSSATRGARALLLLNRSIFFSLLAVIALTAIPYGTVEPWWEAAFQCLIFGLVALWIIEGMASDSWGLSDGRLPFSLLMPLMALVVYTFLQTMPLGSAAAGGWPTISADPYGTRFVALKLLALALAAALLWRYTSSRRRLRALIYTVLAIAVASAIFGIVRETTHRNGIGFLLPQLRPQVGYGQFINRNHFAYLMEMAFGLALGLTIGRGERRDRLVYMAAAAPVWMALVLANSRGGILSMLSQLIFLALMYVALYPAPVHVRGERENGKWSRIPRAMSKLPVRIALCVILLAAMIVGVFWIGGDPLAKRLETLQGEVASEDAAASGEAQRKQIWQATWKMFKDHPVSGIGLGSYWVAITEYYDVPGKKRPYAAHNDYLELLVSGGIIGAALGLWFIIALLYNVREVLRTKDSFRRAACLGALTGLFGVAVHSLVDFGLQITANATICVALVIIATARLEPRKVN